MKNARPLPIVVTPEPDCLADWKQEEPLIERLPGLVRRLVDDFLAADKRAEELADKLEQAERERDWQPIETAPKDGTAIQLAVRGRHPMRPNGNGYFVTTGRWLWSKDARLPHEDYPDDGGFLELNNDWDDNWGGNIGDRLWKSLPKPPEPKP